MSDRDDDFRRLVPMLPGWTVSEPDGNLVKSLRAFRRADYASFGLPAPDAPLPETFAFVGRIAEQVGYQRDGLTIQFRIGPSGNPLPEAWRVTLGLESDAAPDLAWAACRAAIAAKGGAT